jgi:uncharacterized protein DUF2726
MNVVLWYLLLLVPVAAIAYVVWAYRKRSAEREAASRERYASLAGIPPAAAGAARNEPAAPVVPSKPAITAAAPIARRERFLTQPETLLYYLLKAGLPEHEVFPRVSLALVIESTLPLAPADAWSSRQVLDFAICDKKMQVVAAVQIDGRAARPEVEILGQRLSAAGIRLVRVDPAVLPKREEVRGLMLGS